MVYRSLFMLYSAITWPSRLKPTLPCASPSARCQCQPNQPESCRKSSYGPDASMTCAMTTETLSRPHCHSQLNQLLGDSTR